MILGEGQQVVTVEQNNKIIALDHPAVKERLDASETWRFIMEKGFGDNNLWRKQTEFNPKDRWAGKPAFIIGGSPTLKPIVDSIGWSWLDGEHSIGINHTIESYDGFEWFIFLDERFLQLTKYDMKQYGGKVFFQANCGNFGDRANWIPYFCIGGNPTTDIKEGLFTNQLSGTVALNLALIAGANPIYLLGNGNQPGITAQSYHFRDDYTGEQKDNKRLEKFKGAYGYFNHFEKYKDRVIHVSDNTDIPVFQKMKTADFCEMITRRGVTKAARSKELTICHIGCMPSIKQQGTISQYIFDKCIGKHVFSNIRDGQHPEADIYLLECTMNGNERFRAFRRPNPKSKVVSIIHSTGSCMPSMDSDAIINLTKDYQRIFANKGIRSDVIGAGIDMTVFEKHIPDYSNHVFGRITRMSAGKVHPRWNEIVEAQLEADPQAQCIMMTNNPESQPILRHERMEYDTSIKVDDIEAKARGLARLSLYVHADGGTRETFSLGLLEAMAVGLPCIVMNYQAAMIEVLGEGAIIANSIDHVKQLIAEILPAGKRKAEIGAKNRARARTFSVDKMVREYNQVFERVLN
jgi:glycosyltransferase involved in cell wall biosynthesis